MDYRHLLTGAVANLPTATCAYWDDLRSPPSVDELIQYIEMAFTRLGQEPAMVDVQVRGSDNPKRLPYKKFLQTFSDMTIAELSVYAKASDDLSQLWSPPSYATARLDERVKFMAVYVSSVTVCELLGADEIARVALTADAGAAYRFRYPLGFSPVAYINGLSFAPSRRALGEVTREDEIRVSNYRDNCWRGNHAHQGFFRDLYELVIFNETTANRMIGATTLVDWIVAGQRGSVRTHGRLTAWEPGATSAVELQRVLDSERVLLAGFSPDDEPIYGDRICGDGT